MKLQNFQLSIGHAIVIIAAVIIGAVSIAAPDSCNAQGFGDAPTPKPYWVVDAYIFETPTNPVPPSNPYLDFYWDDICFTIEISYHKALRFLPDINIEIGDDVVLDPFPGHTSGSIDDSDGNYIGGYSINHGSSASTLTCVSEGMVGSVTIHNNGTASSNGMSSQINGAGTAENPFQFDFVNNLSEGESLTASVAYYPC